MGISNPKGNLFMIIDSCQLSEWHSQLLSGNHFPSFAIYSQPLSPSRKPSKLEDHKITPGCIFGPLNPCGSRIQGQEILFVTRLTIRLLSPKTDLWLQIKDEIFEPTTAPPLAVLNQVRLLRQAQKLGPLRTKKSFRPSVNGDSRIS
jgi:hypothetical protein